MSRLLDRLIRNEPGVAAATLVAPAGVTPARDIALVLIRNAEREPIDRCLPFRREMKNVFVTIIQKTRRTDRLEVSARNRFAALVLDRDRLDPVDRVLEDEEAGATAGRSRAATLDSTARAPRLRKSEPSGFKHAARLRIAQTFAPIQIAAALLPIRILSVAQSRDCRAAKSRPDRSTPAFSRCHPLDAISSRRSKLRAFAADLPMVPTKSYKRTPGCTVPRAHAVVTIATMSDKPSKLKIADREFSSRLLVGTGKFASNELMRDALEASGTEIVTVALRRADLSGKGDPFANILDFIDPKRYLLLPNTSGARNAEEAVRLARLAVSAGLPNWVKLEIHPDPRYLLPDPVETLAAAERFW